MATIVRTAAQTQLMYRKEFEKIRKLIAAQLDDLMTVPDAGVSIEMLSANEAVITAYYPDLMDDSQAKADQFDMASIARHSKYFKQVTIYDTVKPTYSDLYRGILPSISIELTLV